MTQIFKTQNGHIFYTERVDDCIGLMVQWADQDHAVMTDVEVFDDEGREEIEKTVRFGSGLKNEESIKGLIDAIISNR